MRSNDKKNEMDDSTVQLDLLKSNLQIFSPPNVSLPGLTVRPQVEVEGLEVLSADCENQAESPYHKYDEHWWTMVDRDF